MNNKINSQKKKGLKIDFDAYFINNKREIKVKHDKRRN